MRGSLFEDTSIEVEEVLVSLLREAGTERRLSMAMALSSTAWKSSLQGFRSREPELGEAELRLRLAEFLYGREMMAKVRRRIGLQS